MRENTERPEAVDFGVAALVGTEEDALVTAVSTLLDVPEAHDRMARAANPYGDGHACERVLAAIAQMFDRGPRLPDFNPGAGQSRR